MRRFHPLSFSLGLLSGLLVLVLFAGGMRLLQPAPSGFPGNRGARQQQGTGGSNLSRMAERLGMTEQELQSALTSGKSLQDIAKERGVDLPAGGFRGANRSAGQTASGATASDGSRSPSSASSVQAPQ